MESPVQIQRLLQRSWALRGIGNYEESRDDLELVKQLCHLDDYDSLGRMYHIYMQHEFDHGNLREALEYNRVSILNYSKAQNRDKLAHAIRHRADLFREMGQLIAAEIDYLRALDMYRENEKSKDGDLANTLRGYALVLAHKNQHLQAIDTWQEIGELYKKHHFDEGLREVTKQVESLRLKIS